MYKIDKLRMFARGTARARKPLNRGGEVGRGGTPKTREAWAPRKTNVPKNTLFRGASTPPKYPPHPPYPCCGPHLYPHITPKIGWGFNYHFANFAKSSKHGSHQASLDS